METIMNYQQFTLEPDDLDKVYRIWKIEQHHEGRNWSEWGIKTSYQRVSRTGYNQNFEGWLWEQGGAVVQQNGKRYLVFPEYNRGIEFKLTILTRGI
jgi:GH43 family beta-xylosidase